MIHSLAPSVSNVYEEPVGDAYCDNVHRLKDLLKFAMKDDHVDRHYVSQIDKVTHNTTGIAQNTRIKIRARSGP